jgi:DNA/RNA endonuclease G (NUC1)
MTKELLLKKHRNVSRIDLEYGKTHGWFVRKEGPGKGMSKFFSDRTHGGRYSSLKSALDWRDKTSQFDLKLKPGSVSLKLLVLVVSVLCWSHIAGATEFRPIVLDPSYEHDKWQTLPRDQVFNFAAYTTSFDGPDDDNGDGVGDKWAIPQWVAFEIKRATIDHPLENRPQKWITVDHLHSEGIAPDDSTYAISGTRDLPEVKTDYRFVRGHMCPKDTAERISADAAFNTHTVLNAVPQLQWQNNGIWKKLEGLCLGWADKYSRIWVVAGPVFFNKNPSMWLGQRSEVEAAIPDALFKIVIRQQGDGVEVLAFLFPNILPKTEKLPGKYLVSVDRVEALTGLDFLSGLPGDVQRRVESDVSGEMNW